MSTVSSVIARARVRYTDLDPTIALGYAQEIHRTILRSVKIRLEDVDRTFSVGIGEYVLPDTYVQVWNVDYIESDDSYRTLQAVSLDWLDSHKPGWRRRDSGVPEFYYVTSRKQAGTDADSENVIGFYPKPDTATTGVSPNDFPRAIMTISASFTLQTATELPNSLLSDEVYVAGIKWCYARDETLEEEPMMRGLFQQQLDKNANFMKNIAVKNNSSIIPAFAQEMPRVR